MLDKLDYDLPELQQGFYSELQESIKQKRKFNYQDQINQLKDALYGGKDQQTEIFFQWISKDGHTPIRNKFINRISRSFRRTNSKF